MTSFWMTIEYITWSILISWVLFVVVLVIVGTVKDRHQLRDRDDWEKWKSTPRPNKKKEK